MKSSFWKDLGQVVKTGFKWGAPILGVALLEKYTKGTAQNVKGMDGDKDNDKEPIIYYKRHVYYTDDDSHVGYSDAVKAITEKFDSSYHAACAIAYLKKGEKPEYYEAVISVAESDASSYHKQNMIQNISAEYDE